VPVGFVEPIVNRLSAFFLAFAMMPVLSQAQVPSRLTQPIKDSVAVELAGNVHPLARAENDKGQLPAATRLDRMVLVLKPTAKQESELSALLAAQQDPASPQFHKWLTPQAFGQRFGISAGDLLKVTAWLRSHGFTINEVAPSRRSITFSGNEAQLESAFATQIHRYQVVGVTHIANATNPSIPEALSGVVRGILSLHDFRSQSASRRVAKLGSSPSYTSGTSHYLTPLDYATIYNLNPLYSANVQGKGVTIAIAGRSSINLSDVNTFRSFSGLAANPPTITYVNGINPGLVSGDMDESLLDVEWAGAIGQSANVVFMPAASSSTTDGVDLSVQAIVNAASPAQVVSLSYGLCEQYMSSSGLAFYNNVWKQAAAEGMSVFVSSGDSGAAGCQGGSSSSGTTLGVNGLCTSPYATCVGGTMFNDTSNPSAYWSSTNGPGYSSALSYIPEKVWNESGSAGGSGLWAGGGGVSKVYTQPSFQQSVVQASQANGMRTVPDVSLTASSHDGYLVVDSGSYYIFGGTSASAPSMAGIMALVVQQMKGVGQGNANPLLYGMLNAVTSPFHPTPTGNNTVPGVTGFSATGATYNLATGLGSVDGTLLVNQWAATVGGVSSTLTTNPASVLFLQGSSQSITVSLAADPSVTAPVTFSISGLPMGVTASWSANSISPSSGTATSTLTLTASSLAETGILTAKVAGVSSATAASATLQIEVQRTPKFR